MGLAGAPADVILAFLPGSDDWTVIVQSRLGDPAPINAWLRRHRPRRLQGRATLTGTVVHATFRTVPGIWSLLATSFGVRSLEVGADGFVWLRLEGDTDAVMRFVANVRARRGKGDVGTVVSLTPRQLEALKAAVAAGYYAIPRTATLEDVAKSLEVSAGAVSELLRRAEARLVADYIVWGASTRASGRGQAKP